MLVFFTDTDTDFTPKEAEKYHLHLISMPYTMNEEEIFPYESFKEFNPKEYYDVLRTGVVPKTSAISPQKYIDYFKPFLQEGHDIVYVHFSKAMSGTFNALNLAIEDLKQAYPNQNIYTIDTKGITLGSYGIVLLLAKKYANGASIEELLSFAEKEVDKYATYFYADDLKFFAKSGRVSNFSAFFGNLLGIHPIINMGSDGKMNAIGKAKGRQGSLNRILDYVEELQEDIKDYPIIIGHSDSLHLATKLSGMIKERFGDDLDIHVVDVNPTAGAHCGPNSVGVSFHAKHR